MKIRIHPQSLVCATALAVLIFATSPASAAIVFTNVFTGPTGNGTATTTDEIAYAADVSTTDLLHGIVGTGGSWTVSSPTAASPNGLNDGIHGGDFNSGANTSAGITIGLTGAAWATDGTTSIRTFVLGGGPSGTGFNVTRIQSIAAWSGAGFANQKYEVHVRQVGSATFSLLTAVDYQPFTNIGNTSGGSSKVNVTENAGFLASGIDAIRFSILDTNSVNSGGVVMREIDVFGSAVPEPSAAVLLGLGGLALLRRRRS